MVLWVATICRLTGVVAPPNPITPTARSAALRCPPCPALLPCPSRPFPPCPALPAASAPQPQFARDDLRPAAHSPLWSCQGPGDRGRHRPHRGPDRPSVLRGPAGADVLADRAGPPCLDRRALRLGGLLRTRSAGSRNGRPPHRIIAGKRPRADRGGSAIGGRPTAGGLETAEAEDRRPVRRDDLQEEPAAGACCTCCTCPVGCPLSLPSWLS